MRDLNKVFRAANRMYRLRMKTVYDTEIAIHANAQIDSGTNAHKKVTNSVSQFIEYSIIVKAIVINVGIMKKIDVRRFSAV